MDNCIICLETNCDILTRISTLSNEWFEANIQRIIEKHLWWWYMKPAKTSNSRWICGQCWQEISSFHSFYCRVEAAHQNYQEIYFSLQQTNYSHDEGIVMKCEIKECMEYPIPYLELSANDDNSEEINEEMEIKLEMPLDNVDHNNYINTIEKSKDVLSINNLDKHSRENFQDESNVNENMEEKLLMPKVEKLKTIKRKSKAKIKRTTKKQKPKLPYKSPELKESKDSLFKEMDYKLECCLCSKAVSDFGMLRGHFRNEHNTRAYAMCCGKKFFKRCYLVHHLQWHNDPDLFKCQTCTKTFDSRVGLENHQKTHELRERIYNCEECGKSYFSINSFQSHKLKHIPESEKKFNCSQCDKKFATNYMRHRHEDKIHSAKYNKICDICGKVFTYKNTFLRHMEEHAGVPTAVETCNICGAKLSNKLGLKYHVKMQHRPENQMEQICPYCSKVSPNINAHNRHIQYSHKMQRKHACHLCDKAFKYPNKLKEHVSTHTGEALYTCPHCPRTFKSNANMHKHRKTAHRQEWEENRLNKMSGKLMEKCAL